ncbi:hypothetical protein [Paraglaciecola sp.]|uniref:hypothetical protein n=1 Tax=Paraglaciecola sp. TaxID=1920173 RepID=UPI003263EB1F
MNTISTVLSVILLCVVGFGGYKWSNFQNQLDVALTEKNAAIEKQKITVKSSTLARTSEYIYSTITNQYMHFYDSNFAGRWTRFFGGDDVEILFEWDYVFSYGVKIPSGWEFCFASIDHDPGYYSVNIPNPELLSKNVPSPGITKAFELGDYDINSVTALNQMQQIATDRINEDSQVHLENSEILGQITLGISEHISSLINSSYSDSNPVVGVVVKYTDTSSCES